MADRTLMMIKYNMNHPRGALITSAVGPYEKRRTPVGRALTCTRAALEGFRSVWRRRAAR